MKSIQNTIKSQQHADGTSSSPPVPDVRRQVREEPHTAFPVLLAIANDDCTTPMVRLAETLATERGATPSLLYVMELSPVATLDGGIGVAALTETLFDPNQQAKDQRALRAACHIDTGLSTTWPLDIELGNAAASIVSHANQRHAQLIVMGLHHHAALARIVTEDTLGDVISIGAIPVLALRPELVHLPKTVVVAMDFSVASLRSLRHVRQLLADDATIHLVFVEPTTKDIVNESEQARRFIEANGVDMAFDHVRTILNPAPGMTVTTTKRFGNTVEELQAVCAAVHPDLVAIGSQRHPLLKRLFLGTVTKAMINDGRWSVLIVPPTARD